MRAHFYFTFQVLRNGKHYEPCGTDRYFRPDNRLSLNNMYHKADEVLRQKRKSQPKKNWIGWKLWYGEINGPNTLRKDFSITEDPDWKLKERINAKL